MKKILMLLSVTLLAACNKNQNEYDASGIFEATEVIVSAKAQGELLSLRAEEGDEVRMGDTLGTIDVRLLDLKRQQLQQTQASTDSRQMNVQVQLASLEQQLANLEREKSRFEALLEANAASQKQVDDIAYQIVVLRKQVAATHEQLSNGNRSLADQSQAMASQISQVEEQIIDATVTSPIEGTVLQRYCEVGEYAMPGKPLFKIANLEEMTLRAYITADQYDRLQLGQTVRVMIDRCEEPYQGTLTWIASKAEFTPKTIQTRDERANLVYAIKVRVHNDGLIKIGMYADVSFAH